MNKVIEIGRIANDLEINKNWIIDPNWKKDICFAETVKLLQMSKTQ